jgi:hypothetical protein
MALDRVKDQGTFLPSSFCRLACIVKHFAQEAVIRCYGAIPLVVVVLLIKMHLVSAKSKQCRMSTAMCAIQYGNNLYVLHTNGVL